MKLHIQLYASIGRHCRGFQSEIRYADHFLPLCGIGINNDAKYAQEGKCCTQKRTVRTRHN
jgi:hypothetical protein